MVVMMMVTVSTGHDDDAGRVDTPIISAISGVVMVMMVMMVVIELGQLNVFVR